MPDTHASEPGRATPGERERALVARRERLLGPAYRLFYEHPVHVVRGDGVWLWDADGRRYLDAYNNVAGVGHCHPRVVEAIAHQVATLNTHTRYLHEAVLDYAEALLATFPGGPRHVMFTCTGSEANDLAYRIACAATGGTGFVATRLAYHGGTQVIAGLSPSLGPAVPVGRDVRLVAAPDGYRGPGGPAAVGAAFAAGVRAAFADLRSAGVKPAALIVDTVFSSDGVFTDPPGFLQEAVAAAREAGALLIADEVQAGFGRTGSHLWGHARHGLDPDIVTLGKPMGGGYPVAGVVARPALLGPLARSRYFNTFGGTPVAAAAGLAVLHVIRDERLVDNAARSGAHLLAGLRALADRHPAIGDVRGAGLFIGVELVEDRATKAPAAAGAARVVNALRDRGVLVSATGPGANVLKIRPPLPFTVQHGDLLLEALDAVL
jgi:4-aminobutyrate aminotransferase-like enzyme